MTPVLAKKTLYTLGRVVFLIENCDPAYEEAFRTLLPPYLGPQLADDQIAKLRVGERHELRNLLNQVLRLHASCLWIDAGCLISPKGQTVLIAGASGSGKSTTTMALALGYGWKVLAEDILLLDLENDKLIGISSPFSIKKGTLELLETAIGKTLEPLWLDEWSPLNEMAAKGEFEAKFDLALILKKDWHASTVQISPLHSASYVNKLLPISSALRINGAADRMARYLSGGQCLEFVGGTLTQRLNAILSTEPTAKKQNAQSSIEY